MKNKVKIEVEINWEVPAEDRPFYLDIEGKRIYVNEEIYRMYKEPIWADRKRNERAKRCSISDGKGKLKRCMEDCGLCSHAKSGFSLSLDRMYDEYAYEVADNSKSILDGLVEEESKKMIWSAVDGLEDEVDRQIIRLFSEGLSERAIAEKVGLSQKAVNKRKTKSFAELREKLKDYR